MKTSLDNYIAMNTAIDVASERLRSLVPEQHAKLGPDEVRDMLILVKRVADTIDGFETKDKSMEFIITYLLTIETVLRADHNVSILLWNPMEVQVQ